MIFLYWHTFRAISARASKMAAAARKRKSIEVTMSSRGDGATRTRAVDIDDGQRRPQQRPAAATVVVQAVINGSGGVDTASTPIIGDQKDSATVYPDYQAICSAGDKDQPTTGTSDVDASGHGHVESAEDCAATTTTSGVGDADDAVVRRSSQRQRRHRRLTVVQPVHDSPSLSHRPLFRSGRQQPSSSSMDPKQRAGKTVASSLRMRRSAIFAFGLQRIVQKPEKLATKRERKATQTLAIVLGTSSIFTVLHYSSAELR